MALFGKKQAEVDKRPKRDRNKARRFFEHAQAVGDARNYDYAIECYINGLRHDPDNMVRHEALYDVALKRKVGGGKPAPLAERLMPPRGDAVDKLLHAEKLWAKDPLNSNLMIAVMKKAVEADLAEEELNIGEVAFWVGTKILEGVQDNRKPSVQMFIDLRDLFSAVEAFNEAIDACQIAIDLAPEGQREVLMGHLKDLDAERTMKANQEARSRAGMAGNVRDMDKQKDLEDSEAIVQTAAVRDDVVARRRAEYEAAPDDTDKAGKYVAALIKKDANESDLQAIEVLQGLFEKTQTYRWKKQIGDIRMRMFNRQIRNLKAQMGKPGPQSDELSAQYQKLVADKLAFELEEFRERSANYPTDTEIRFELARRLFGVKKFDEAVSCFQESQSDPRYKAVSLYYLGQCYSALGLPDEAIDTYRAGVEAHGADHDKLGLDLNYLLMDALERRATQGKDAQSAKEAARIASKLLQTNINYRDVRQRAQKLRDLVQNLGGE